MNFLTSKISRNVLDKLISPYGSELRTLEIGSYGNPDYGKYFPNKVGIDVKNGKGVDIVASVYELPFNAEEFDVILCMSVLEHLEGPAKAILEMKRVLKVGGSIIISVPFMFPIHDAPGDYWRFTKYGLIQLFKEGWKIEKLVAETTNQQFLGVLIQRFAYQTKMRLNRISKLLLFTTAWTIAKLPNMFKKVYGDIKKQREENEAFASAFFMVAKKL